MYYSLFFMRKIFHRAECNSVGPHDNQRSESKQWTLVILPAYKLVIQPVSQWTKIENSIWKLFGEIRFKYQVNQIVRFLVKNHKKLLMIVKKKNAKKIIKLLYASFWLGFVLKKVNLCIFWESPYSFITLRPVKKSLVWLCTLQDRDNMHYGNTGCGVFKRGVQN